MTLEEAIAECESLRELEYDWNSYGAPTISGAAIEAAIGLIEKLYSISPEYPLPTARPTSTGSVMLEWPSEMSIIFSLTGWVCEFSVDEESDVSDNVAGMINDTMMYLVASFLERDARMAKSVDARDLKSLDG